MPDPNIPVAGPWISEKEVEYVTKAAREGWYDCASDYQNRFEFEFAAYLGRKHAVALPSCTSAIHLALLALGIGPGDEVIVPDLTWIASAAPINYVGATPVFADIDLRTWCISPEAVEKLITPKTKAVILVDLYGNMPEMNALLRLAEKHRLSIIEDAAQAIGSTYREKKAGCFGEVSVFSFHGSKTLTTGEGGMLVTDNPSIYKRCLILRDHGRPCGDKLFQNIEIGYKYKMSSLQAALGLAQLERIDELVAKKVMIFHWYENAMSDLKGFCLNASEPYVKNSYWMTTTLWENNLTKEELIDQLFRRNIETRPIFSPLSSLPAYANQPGVANARSRNKVSYAVSPRGINLPSGLNLTRDTVERVVENLKEVTFRCALSAP